MISLKLGSAFDKKECYLIEKQNIDIDSRGEYGKTILQYACENGHYQIMQYLISKDANIETTNYWGDHIIHSAARVDLLPMVKYLIEQQNVDIETKGYNEKTPLHYACERGHLPIVKYLISTDASVDLKEKWERTPLHLSVLFGHADIVKYFVYNCANIYTRMFDGQTPYDLAKNNEIRNFI